MKTVKAVLYIRDDQVFLTVTEGTSFDTVGPMENGKEEVLVLEEPDYTTGAPRNVHKLARKQEMDLARDIGGIRQPGSGNIAGKKGDVRKQGKLRGEAKFTAKKQYVLKHAMLQKIAGEATLGERPVVQIDFMTPTGNKLGSYAVVPFEDWLRLTENEDKHNS